MKEKIEAFLKLRARELESEIASERLAGNEFKEGKLRHALAENTIMQCEIDRMESWSPIADAPKDGTRLWLYCNEDDPSQFEGYYSVEFRCWMYAESLVQDVQDAAIPTHFQPLPEPPKEGA
jgi:hypothetical protein